MKKEFNNIGIDKLSLCYIINDDSILHGITDEDVEVDLGEFRLHRITSGHFKNAFNILYQWDYNEDEGLNWHIFGTLKFGRYTDKENIVKMAWINFENRILYTSMYPNVNLVILAEYQSSILGMSLRNITELEICFDTYRNAPKAVKYMLRNKNIKTILNGKVVEVRENNINEILYVHKGSLNRYLDMSIYVKQKDKDGFELKVYDKKKEIIESSHKNYILNWYLLQAVKPLYRIEVTLKHQHLKQYINDKKIELSHNLFSDKAFLLDCFLNFANRLIRFQDKSKEVYSILEIL